jgi:hypothetical protein
MAYERDVVEVLEQDHREVEEMFAELESLRGAATEEAKSRRKAVTEQVTIELVRHSVAEEVLVYPQVEDKVSAEEAEHAREEHAGAEETLHRLEKLNADDPAFEDDLATLMAEIRHHITEGEGRMFAHHLRQVIDADGREACRGVQEGRSHAAASERAERAAPADGGRSGGVAVRPHARPRDEPRHQRLTEQAASAREPGAIGHRQPTQCPDPRQTTAIFGYIPRPIRARREIAELHGSRRR